MIKNTDNAYWSIKKGAALEYITNCTSGYPVSLGIILGTGLGGLVKDVSVHYKLDYNNIPYFPVSTVESHHGNLILGEISGTKAVIMQGRFHFYEGYSYADVTFPVEIMSSLGVQTLIVSNACGGLNPALKTSDLMIMTDHINFHFTTPVKDSKLPLCNKRIYDRELIALAQAVALENKVEVKSGTYLSLTGPSLETSAEYRMTRKIGADVVGMSTIPEALTAVNHNMRVLGFSIVTDMGLADALKPAAIEHILAAAAVAEPNLTLLTRKIIERLQV